MIYSKIILNTRGMIVYENPQFTLLNYDSYEFEELRLFLFSLDLEKYPERINIPDKFMIENNIEAVIDKDNNGKYIIFVENTDSLDSLANDFLVMKELRLEQLKKFKGILLVDFDDSYGPDIKYNSDPTVIDEENAMRIGLQCFTTLGIGSGGEFTPGFHGPLILNELRLSILIYAFIRPAPNSKDPRLARSGRPATIILLYQNPVDADNKIVKNFVETSLQRNKLSEEPNLTKEKMSFILEEIKDMTLFALDLSEVDRVHNIRLKEKVNLLQNEVISLREKISELEEENKLLKEKLE